MDAVTYRLSNTTRAAAARARFRPGSLKTWSGIEMVTTLNAEASTAALEAGVECATDITDFGLVGHLYKLARASGVTAVIDSTAVPYLDGVREALAAGYISGGTRRNLDWVRPHVAHESASFVTGTVVVADGSHGLPETWPRP
jgi:hypothetical protein